MNKARLLKLAKLLNTVPPEMFDMGVWGRSRKPANTRPQCCTRACALGWATAIPEFREAGLEMRAYGGDASRGIVHFGGETGHYAGEKFFGLNYGQCDYLFLSGSNDPREKAKEIRALVRKTRT